MTVQSAPLTIMCDQGKAQCHSSTYTHRQYSRRSPWYLTRAYFQVSPKHTGTTLVFIIHSEILIMTVINSCMQASFPRKKPILKRQVWSVPPLAQTCIRSLDPGCYHCYLADHYKVYYTPHTILKSSILTRQQSAPVNTMGQSLCKQLRGSAITLSL